MLRAPGDDKKSITIIKTKLYAKPWIGRYYYQKLFL